MPVYTVLSAYVESIPPSAYHQSKSKNQARDVYDTGLRPGSLTKAERLRFGRRSADYLEIRYRLYEDANTRNNVHDALVQVCTWHDGLLLQECHFAGLGVTGACLPVISGLCWCGPSQHACMQVLSHFW